MYKGYNAYRACAEESKHIAQKETCSYSTKVPVGVFGSGWVPDAN
jgi:hypothetical protein